MPNYNQGNYIKHALEGILNQKLLPEEVIIIDDGSTDNSVEIIESLLPKNNILKLIRKEKNEGVVASINKGLSLVKNDYVYFAAADDYIFPDFFSKSLDMLQHNPQAGLCSSLTRIIDENGKDKGFLKTPTIIKNSGYIDNINCEKKLIKYGSWIQSNTALYRKSALNEVGGFMPELKSYADSFVNLHISLSKGVCFVPEYLCAWRRLETGFSSTTSNNPVFFIEIIEKATKCMRKNENQVFKERFVKNWQKRMMWMFINDVQENSFEKIKVFKGLLNYNFLFSLFFKINTIFYWVIKIIRKIIYIFSLNCLRCNFFERKDLKL